MNRDRLLPIALFLLLRPWAAAAQEKEKAQEATPSFPAQVELVTVDTVVTDKKGTPLTGLTKDDFILTEDGVPQAITSFEAVQLPATPSATPPPRPPVSTNVGKAEAHGGRTFVILFDDLHMTPFQARRAKTAVGEFLRNGMREGDRVSLISTGGDAWWTTRMEAGRDELIALLKRLEGRHIPDTGPERMTDYEAMRIQVYGDPLVLQRVTRRYQSYGVTTDNAYQSRNPGSTNSDPAGDPIVRGRASETYFQAVAKNRLTLEVMARVLDSLTSAKGRKSMILVSEGFIYDPNLDEFKQVVQSSRRANCAVYFVDTRGLQGMPDYFGAQFGPSLDTQDLGAIFADPLEASEGSESIAGDTGGFTVKNSNDLTKGIERIADESRTYYLLGYYPKNTAMDGKFRKIQVKTARKGATVRARKGYYAPVEGGKSAADSGKKKDKKAPQDPRFQEALDSPYEVDQIPLRMTAFVFEETLLGKARVEVAAEVDVRGFGFQEKEGRFTDTLEFLLVAAHRETGEYFRYDQKVDMKLLPETRDKLGKSWFPVVRDFELAPGGYQAKIVVRDKQSGKMGTVLHEFEVPDLSKLRTSTLVLSDVTQPAPEGSQATPRPVHVARRSFAAGANLFCQFEVFGAAPDKATSMPKVSAGYVVRKSDGTVLAQADPSLIRPTSLGKLSRLVGMSLKDATPGDYELVLSVKDELSGKNLEVREPFTVEAAS